MLKLFDNFWRIFFQIFKKESNFGPVMSVTFAPGLTSLQGYLSDKNPNDTGAESRYCSNFTQILTLSLCALIPDSNWLKLHDLFLTWKSWNSEIFLRLRFFWPIYRSWLRITPMDGRIRGPRWNLRLLNFRKLRNWRTTGKLPFWPYKAFWCYSRKVAEVVAR